MILYYLCLILGFQVATFGEVVPTTKIQFFQILYSGDKNETFESKNSGLGAELILNSKNQNFNYFTKGRITTVTGSQDFLDAGTPTASTFTFYQTSFEVGATVYPIPRKAGRMNLYLGTSALISYNYLQLGSKTLTELNSTFQSLSLGYCGLMGVEIPFYKNVSLTAEFSQRYEVADLVEQSGFSMNGFSISAGFGW